MPESPARAKIFGEADGGKRAALGALDPNTPTRRKKKARKSMGRRVSFAPPADMEAIRECVLCDIVSIMFAFQS
jgi:hypothetical protein